MSNPKIPDKQPYQSPFLSVKQVSEYLQLNEKKVYSLANDGHIPATKVTGKWMFPRELIDRWMLDSSHSGLLNDRLIIGGSDDPLLSRVISNLAHDIKHHALISYSPSSTSIGLNLLQSRRIDICVIHWGAQAESNLRHPALLQQYSQSRQWVLIRAFQREQGLIISPKVIKLIQQQFSLQQSNSQEQLSFLFNSPFLWAKRQIGSGSQRFLQEILVKDHRGNKALDTEIEAKSEREAAAIIAMGLADISPGTRASAKEFGQQFISLGWESVDLVVPRNIWFRHLFQEFIDELKSITTQEIAETLVGYDLSSCGELVWGDD